MTFLGILIIAFAVIAVCFGFLAGLKFLAIVLGIFVSICFIIFCIIVGAWLIAAKSLAAVENQE